MSLDGFVAGPNGEMDWIVYDREMEKYAHELHNTTDAAIYGRVTYQMMESYWPSVLADPSSEGGALEHARWFERVTKVVFSKTLQSAKLNNTLLIHDHVAAEMEKIKQEPGKDLWMIGSPTLAQAFMALDLIDEYRINLNPVMLGSGKFLFAGQGKPLRLKLLEAKTFADGVAALRYERVRE